MLRFKMAHAVLALGRSSNLVRIRAEERPVFIEYLIKASDDRIVAEGGGRLIRNSEGQVIGAVGVTGDTQDRDDELAIHGIYACGFRADEDCADLGGKVRLS